MVSSKAMGVDCAINIFVMVRITMQALPVFGENKKYFLNTSEALSEACRGCTEPLQATERFLDASWSSNLDGSLYLNGSLRGQE